MFSHPFAPEPHTLTLDQIPAAEVAGSYDDAVSSLDNPNEAEILVVDINPETGAPRLGLESADSTELVRLPLSN